MKKFTCAMLALCLALCLAAPATARAEATSTSLFGYVIDMGGATIELMTENEEPYTFTCDSATAMLPYGEVNIDDAIVLKYEGTLNQSAAQQSVKVVQIDVLTVMYGIVSDANADTISVLNDEDGRNYTFNIENADITSDEDRILANDQVELAFSGLLGAPDVTLAPDFLHVTVYGQAEDDAE